MLLKTSYLKHPMTPPRKHGRQDQTFLILLKFKNRQKIYVDFEKCRASLCIKNKKTQTNPIFVPLQVTFNFSPIIGTDKCLEQSYALLSKFHVGERNSSGNLRRGIEGENMYDQICLIQYGKLNETCVLDVGIGLSG